MIEKLDNRPWYSGITRYQWLVLLIASLGWVFDVFEGQIFVASMKEAIPSLVDKGTSVGRISLYNNIAFASFLMGGALGGIVFGAISDRIGRKKTMSLTILFYSLFTCVSAFSQEWWHLAGLRFLVAMGVGGEWAIASSMVAEVFPKRARAHVGGIFHASSVFGTYLAVAAGTFLIGNSAVSAWATNSSPDWIANFVDPASLPWRLGFAIGVLPALLIIWIRVSLKEPESWQLAQKLSKEKPGLPMGNLVELFRGELLRHTLVGVSLAAVGMATFWGAHIYGKNILLASVENSILSDANPVNTPRDVTLTETPEMEKSRKDRVAKERATILAPHKDKVKKWEMRGMFLTTTGGGLGLVLFGPLCQWIGRRPAFLLYHLGGFGCALIIFQVPLTTQQLLYALPIFGFLTLGMHAGYAVYFPELYPTRLRGTGTGFCFNAGRMIAAPILFAAGWMQSEYGFTLPNAATVLCFLFLLGVIVLAFAPETRGRELPE